MSQKSKEEVVEEFRIQSIKDAAIRVIGRKGIAGASMQEIAEEAGIAKGTIYLYFENQQEVLEAAVDHALAGLLDKLTAAIRSPGTFRQRLRALIHSHVEFFDTHHDLFQVHMAIKFPEGLDASATRCDRNQRPHYQAYLKEMSLFLEDAIKSEEVHAGHSRRLALFLEEGVVAVLFERLSEKNPPPVSEEVDWLTSTILDGISKKRSRA